MATLDAFSKQIVKLVRNMPDEAILDLVRNQLGAVSASATSAQDQTNRSATRGNSKTNGSNRKTKSSAKSIKQRGSRGAGRAKRATAAEKEAMLVRVENAIKNSSGLSASQIANKTKLPKTRVQAAVRELKATKRIFQGGERRFARYASDARTAKAASLSARKASKSAGK